MKTVNLVLTLLIISANLFSQGGIDVKYISEDEMGQNLIGQKVKIDFKSEKGAKQYLVYKAKIPDTVKITINHRLIHVIEHKGMGVDYWSFYKEYLESFDYEVGQVLRITDIEILAMDTDSIQFRMTMEQYKKVGEMKLERVNLETTDTWILKNKIEGILVRN